MALAAGTRLGPHEILAPIGAGGMGEVYRAHDARLGRDVAIKVSSEQFSERFEREARTIASLNHTNLCHLYDVGPNYLVMELVEGETLCGPLRFAEALPLIRQLIDGIEAAHERNIVHRDLKPANIKVTHDGVVKILDFGLAKASAPEPEGTSDNSPTMTMGATQAGTILGTAAYMSPEQAKGKTADKRSDIWSFGAVVYELLTGKKPFAGDSVVETLGAVINKEPDWSAVPERARRLLEWCLEKDRKQRLQAIGDARRILEEVPETAPAVAPRSRFGMWPAVAAGILAVLAAVAGLGWWRAARPPELKPLVHLEVDLGADVSLPVGDSQAQTVVLSPDGTRLVYVSGTPQRLFTRRLDHAKATELPGTEGAGDPFFSPDGQWVGFFTNTRLNKISVDGGASVAVADVPVPSGASWGADGNIVVGGVLSHGLRLVPQGGGAPAPLTQLAAGELAHVDPQILPGGKAVIFVALNASAEGDKVTIEALMLAGHRRKVLVRGGLSPHYLPSGHLIYSNQGTLFAIAFDPERLETYGSAVPILDDVEHNLETYAPLALTSSRAGTLLYRRSAGVDARGPLMTFQWLDPTGKMEPLLAKPGNYADPRLSPEGKRLALLLTDGASRDVWVYDPQRDSMTRRESKRCQL
jgi:hypothetical protein